MRKRKRKASNGNKENIWMMEGIKKEKRKYEVVKNKYRNKMKDVINREKDSKKIEEGNKESVEIWNSTKMKKTEKRKEKWREKTNKER